MPANKNSMKDLLNKKAPAVLRQTIVPVDIIDAAGKTPERETRPEPLVEKPVEQGEPEKQTVSHSDKVDAQTATDKTTATTDREEAQEKATATTHPKKRVVSPMQKTERNTRTKKPRLYSERDIQALLAVEKREKVRYSFEAFADQKEDIQRVCDLYEESTGQHLSASRLLRELLDSFLPGAIKTFENTDR